MRVQDTSARYDYLSIDELNDKFVTNNAQERRRVLTELKHALSESESFDMAVAFVTKSGVISLLQSLLNFTERGGRARIVASDYLAFTQPDALNLLHGIDGIELKLLQGVQYHGKLFLFKKKLSTQVLVGSSNLTQAALSKNDEINFLFSDGSERIDKAEKEFSRIWSNADVLSPKLLADYEQRYLANKQKTPAGIVKLNTFTPNELQKQALENLKYSRNLGKRRGLVVSATGTGKTVLSAFDVRQCNAKSALFLVHRTTIAKKSMETYQSILKGEYSFGLVGGDSDDWDADFLFGTVQTLSKAANMARFEKNRFDYIVIDETHRAASDSYQRVIDFFEPKFLLGMTATPERSDNQNIFDIFNNNVVCDIRLQDALETEILCPFHYFGIADLCTLDGDDISLQSLTRQKRFAHIYSQSLKLGSDRQPIKALCFLSRVEEAEAFADFLVSTGKTAIALSGKSSELEKQNAIRQLDDGELQYIVTVDIFNEGIDIPSINQIIMARPTQSAIIFVQQLGRGLRKYDGKEYLTVIDIVGNYDNNFLIPIALYGDRSRNKDTLRRLMRSEESLLPGESTISFDRIAKERIFKAIQTSPKIGIRDLKSEYRIVKAKIGETPSLMDIRQHGDLSPYLFCNQSQVKSLHEFASKYDKDYDSSEVGSFPLLGLLIKEGLDGVRPFEPIALRLLLENGQVDYAEFSNYCDSHCGITPSLEDFTSTLNTLSFHYGQATNARVFDVINVDSKVIGKDLASLNSKQILLINDAIDNALGEYSDRRQIGPYNQGFIVGAKYTYKETFRILGWNKNPNPQNVGGYFYNRDTNDCAIFVNYNKDEEIAESTQYNDYFIDRKRFHWTTKNSRTLASPEVKALLEQDENKLRVPLFIRKEAKAEGSARYYIGELKVIKGSERPTTIGGKNAVSMEFEIDSPIPQKLYQHLIKKV